MPEIRKPDTPAREAARELAREPACEAAPRTARHRPPDPIADMSETLAAQARTLDAMFNELAVYGAKHFAEWPSSSAAYMRLALRAQSNYRASVEALARADRAMREARAGDDA